MILNKKELLAFDDFLYMGIDFIKKSKLALPIELLKTDDFFLQKVFEIYNLIENDQISIFDCPDKSGITTALYFIIFYYSLKYPLITILSKNTKTRNQVMDKVFELFENFISDNYSHVLKSNTVFISYDNKKISEIKFLDVVTFDIATTSGILLFDDCGPLKNLDKYRDLIKNKNNHEKIVMNFVNNKELITLAKENNINIKKIKIFNG